MGVSMRKDRNPEYNNRDLLFAHTCELCARANRCSFIRSLEGPEAVCVRLVQCGKQNCEVCLRTLKTCDFKCCFFVQKK